MPIDDIKKAYQARVEAEQDAENVAKKAMKAAIELRAKSTKSALLSFLREDVISGLIVSLIASSNTAPQKVAVEVNGKALFRATKHNNMFERASSDVIKSPVEFPAPIDRAVLQDPEVQAAMQALQTKGIVVRLHSSGPDFHIEIDFSRAVK